jgi:hypothetical protein
MGTLSLRSVSAAGHQVNCLYAFDGLVFSTTYWYPDVPLGALEARVGPEAFRRLLFHIAAFDLNKIASLRPERVCFGAYRRFATPAFAALWRCIFLNVWAQWRYENGIAEPYVPALEVADAPAPPPRARPGSDGLLNLSGCGKDSLVANGILRRIGVPYRNLTYYASIYGPLRAQRALNAPVVRETGAEAVHELWMFDDFLDSPVLDCRPDRGIGTLCAAETPASVFAALPVALHAGATAMALGHERSADTGQMVRPDTGEEVNHQWGKSLEAERLINAYIQEHLIADFSCFSILKPIHDVVIFSLLRGEAEHVPATSSCNVDKPWCGRCPKCAYVYLGYAAFLPDGLVRRTFPGDFLNDPETLPVYRALAGLTGRLPFECVGQAGETRLMLHACRARGLLSGPIARLAESLDRAELGRLIAAYTAPAFDGTNIPEAFRGRYAAHIAAACADARAWLHDVLAGHGAEPAAAAS